MSVRLTSAPATPPIRPRTLEGTPREAGATLQYVTKVQRQTSPLHTPRTEVRSIQSQDLLGKSVPTVRPAAAHASGHYSPAAANVSGTQSPPQVNLLSNLLKLNRAAPPMLLQRERSPSPPVPTQTPRVSVQLGTHSPRPPQQEPRGSQHTPTAALQMELKELKRILDKQYGDQKMSPLGQTRFSADDERRVAKQVQLVQKVASVAPESKVRELCVNVACQQAEQEIFLRMMSTSLDRLHQQVQALRPFNMEEPSQSMETLQQDVEPSEDSIPRAPSHRDSEAKRSQDRATAMKVMMDAELQASFADFCVKTMHETIGEELHRQSDTIKSLKIQMECLKEVAKQNFTSMEQVETVHNLKEQMSYLNEVTSQSLTALHSLIKQVVSGMNIEEPVQNIELPRKLHTIMEAAGEAGDAEGDRAEIASWVKTVYRDIVSQSSTPPSDSRNKGSKKVSEASPAASTSDAYPVGSTEAS